MPGGWSVEDGVLKNLMRRPVKWSSQARFGAAAYHGLVDERVSLGVWLVWYQWKRWEMYSHTIKSQSQPEHRKCGSACQSNG